jgi:23S rRNA pseudouridine1911/1915/1917 synthase
MKLKAKVPIIYNGFTLLDYVSSRFAYLSADEWRVRISENRHSRKGVVLNADSIVFHLDEITYDMPYFEEEPANLDYKILMQTPDFLAIYKPPNLMVHKSKQNFRHNLIYQLREVHTPKFPTANTVNRLDKDTSGIVMVALKKKALNELSLQFSQRTIKKTYFAVVVGTPQPLSGQILAPLGKIEEPSEDDLKVGRFVIVGGENSKESETEYETIKTENGHSLVRLHPITGRTHQLRVHLAHIGTPIVGDLAYGFGADEYLEYCAQKNITPIKAERHLLHCAEMEFTLRGDKFRVCSSLPKDFEVF